MYTFATRVKPRIPLCRIRGGKKDWVGIGGEESEGRRGRIERERDAVEISLGHRTLRSFASRFYRFLLAPIFSTTLEPRTGIISFREKLLLFLLHPLVPATSVIILLIIISIRDGSKYYTFVSNSLINQISLWRGYDFLARSDRWKREEIEIDYPVADPWSRF